ncbi:MAG: zinc ribbon domain-containing protein, partial [Gemmatimonadota bacterium]|nr:zinc ribbon domain-containing protein [Gemmatimonadota bacterium]MDE2725556.1 zinc ribbon domain-containing protein [Gemmatimonadota bacterium]
RVHHCKACGYKTDRDHNAAINILTLGLQRQAD